MKRVLVEQDSTTGVMGNVKVVREALVLEVLDRFLKGNNVPFACNVLFFGTCFTLSRSRIPAQDAETSKRLGTLLSKRFSGLGEKCLLSWASRKIGLALSLLTSWRSRVEVGYSQSSFSISYGRDVFVSTRENFVI